MMNTGLTINAAANTIEMTKEFARKANAIEMPQIHKLIALTNESFEKAYSE